ncbi:MAG: adenylate kinase [Acidimicrobiaceae bacterium]|nr:adenylate kinase [Acidimicrobiaceae bacterium]MDC1389131.1 adenylate kinase [Acidimicrobiales bacterium]HAY69326.1 adenylate kinase [Acidimicrobiaceae bacterium]
MVLHLAIFGRQGAGKGTQSQRIVDAYGVVHISTGDMLRAAIADETALGLAAQSIMDEGGLVDDETMIGIVGERLAQPDIVERGVLLDGFPRTPTQADELVRILGERSIDAAINLEVSIDEVTARMLERGRDDDTPEAIAKRLGLYESQTRPLLDWFDERGLLLEVDGLGVEDEVFGRVQSALDACVADVEVVEGDNGE